MTKNIEEQYKKLEQTRTLLNPTIISNKKGKIWEYFRNFNVINITNLEQRIKSNIILYKAPLFKIHNSYLVNWPTNNGEDIYIDDDFLSNEDNSYIIDQQLTHEVLHSLCRTDDKKIFGHIAKSENEYLRGINEAVTQMFTDDIENNELSEKDDYLYFVKNTMRVMKNVVGVGSIANQILNNNTDFEDRFNQITNGKFNDFAFILNNIYKTSKQRYYGTITEQEEENLNMYQNLILEFTGTFVKKVARTNPNIYVSIRDDFFNKDFLSNLKIEQLNNSDQTK